MCGYVCVVCIFAPYFDAYHICACVQLYDTEWDVAMYVHTYLSTCTETEETYSGKSEPGGR